MRFAVILLIFAMTSAYLPAMNGLQSAFFKATDDSGIRDFYSKTKESTATDAVSIAYKGAASGMYASQVSGVGKKLDYFTAGKKNLEAAVRKDPENAEIRFLRFAIQAKAPGILGYYGNIEDDAGLIIAYLQKNKTVNSTEFWIKARTFMISSGELTGDQKSATLKLNK